MRTITKAAGAALAGALLLGGCSAGSPAPGVAVTTTPAADPSGPNVSTPTESDLGTPSATLPPLPPPSADAPGVSLADFGYTNGAATRLFLPVGIVITTVVDQPNALVATGHADQAATVEAYLNATLPQLGWTITAQAPGGIRFRQGVWQGSYAAGPGAWGLTVRNDEG